MNPKAPMRHWLPEARRRRPAAALFEAIVRRYRLKPVYLADPVPYWLDIGVGASLLVLGLLMAVCEIAGVGQ